MYDTACNADAFDPKLHVQYIFKNKMKIHNLLKTMQVGSEANPENRAQSTTNGNKQRFHRHSATF